MSEFQPKQNTDNASQQRNYLPPQQAAPPQTKAEYAEKEGEVLSDNLNEATSVKENTTGNPTAPNTYVHNPSRMHGLQPRQMGRTMGRSMNRWGNPLPSVDLSENQQAIATKEYPEHTITTKGPGEWLKKVNPFAQEEVDSEKQAHLRQEFEIYSVHKSQLIKEGHTIVPNDKESSRDELAEDFSKKREKFLNRMENKQRSFWGTDRYNRLMEKWFPDYDLVIQNKVTAVKTSTSLKIQETNQTIEKLIAKVKEAISVADGDVLKAEYLLNDASCYADEALAKKQAAEKVLDEYGKDKKETTLPYYDEVIGKYQLLVGQLQQNIAGVQEDKTVFNTVLGTLNLQQTRLSSFRNKLSGIKDVQQVITFTEVEIVSLSDSISQSISQAQDSNRKTLSVAEEEVRKTFEQGTVDLEAGDAEVASIKQKEIARREAERKRKAEEERKRMEAERKRLAQMKAKRKNNEGSVFGYDASIVKKRGSDHSGKLWDASELSNESTIKINEANYSNSEKEFFEHYELTANAYLKEWYSRKNNSKKLTGSMFVNAAKRVYQKYGHLSYVVPVELALIQARLESGLGTQGASHYNNPFNVGETDKGAKSWVKNMTSPEIGIYAYMDLMANDYLSDKTSDQLLEKQGESFVNEKGSRYASAPRYEMELKAMMGQVMLVAEGKRTKVSVGKGKGKNNESEDGKFVANMLIALGYKDKNLGTAIENFQKVEMFPPLTEKQKSYVKIMNKGDKASFDKKEASGVDGWCGTKGNTLGLIYFMYKQLGVNSRKSESKNKIVSSPLLEEEMYQYIAVQDNTYVHQDYLPALIDQKEKQEPKTKVSIKQKSAKTVTPFDDIPEYFKKAFKIKSSVGPKKWATNNKTDVTLIQQLLQLNGYSLKDDGYIGTLSLNCIFHFQKIQGISADTKISIDGDTVKRLVEHAYAKGAFDQTNKKVNDKKAEKINEARKGKKSDVNTSLIANITDGYLVGIDKSGYLLPKEFESDAKTLKSALEAIKVVTGNFKISCAYRSPEHNVKIGSTATKSQHLYGIAADIQTMPGYTPSSLKTALEKLIKDGKIPEGGIGKYSWGCHYDVRKTKSRW